MEHDPIPGMVSETGSQLTSLIAKPALCRCTKNQPTGSHPGGPSAQNRPNGQCSANRPYRESRASRAGRGFATPWGGGRLVGGVLMGTEVLGIVMLIGFAMLLVWLLRDAGRA